MCRCLNGGLVYDLPCGTLPELWGVADRRQMYPLRGGRTLSRVMTPDELNRLIAWVYPFRRKRGKRLGPFQPNKPAVGAYGRFAKALGITREALHSFRSGKRPIPPWLEMAVRGAALPILPGTGLGSTMADGTVPLKVQAYAKRVDADGMEITLYISGLPPGREALGLDIPTPEAVIQDLRAGFVVQPVSLI